MAVNNLLASPGFAPGWKANRSTSRRCSTRRRASRGWRSSPSPTSSDAERMFFVSLLLDQVLGWMRAQSGTTSLRALLYMDEIFGYLPPRTRREGAAADAAEAGPRVRRRHGAGDAEPGRTSTTRRSRTPGRGSSAAPDRARQAARARRSGRRARQTAAFDRGAMEKMSPAGQPRLPAAQRARGRSGRLRVALGDVLPARTAHAQQINTLMDPVKRGSSLAVSQGSTAGDAAKPEGERCETASDNRCVRPVPARPTAASGFHVFSVVRRVRYPPRPARPVLPPEITPSFRPPRSRC